MKSFVFVTALLLFGAKQVFAQQPIEVQVDITKPILDSLPHPENKEALDLWLYQHNKHLQPEKKLQSYYKVIVTVTVKEDGQVTMPRVLRGIGAPYDQEAVRLLKEQPYKWVPGKKDGQPMEAAATYSIDFRLKK